MLIFMFPAIIWYAIQIVIDALYVIFLVLNYNEMFEDEIEFIVCISERYPSIVYITFLIGIGKRTIINQFIII